MLFDNAYIDISLYKGSPEILKISSFWALLAKKAGAAFLFKKVYVSSCLYKKNNGFSRNDQFSRENDLVNQHKILSQNYCEGWSFLKLCKLGRRRGIIALFSWFLS